MTIKYSSDNGKSVTKHSASESIKNFDYPFFIVDLCEAIKNKSILIVTDTRDEELIIRNKINTKYMVRDFEIIPDEELGDSIIFEFQKEDTRESQIFTLRNIKKIEQNDFKKKYYITGLDFEQGTLGFTFK